MEWIFSFAIIGFLVGTDVVCQNCVPDVGGSSLTFWVKEGHPFAINCSLSNCQSRFKGTQWWMNEKRVYGMDFTKRIYETKFQRRTRLVIDHVKIEDAANFTCINDVDPTKNVTIILKIGVPVTVPPTVPPPTTETPSSASHLLRSWTANIPLIFFVYILSKM